MRGSEHGNRHSPTGTEVLTRSGLMVPLDRLGPEHVRLGDIAYALAHQVRFDGHNPLQPSIAAHSLAVEWLAAEAWRRSTRLGPAPQRLRRAALMHDAAEYLVGDNVGAVKLMMRRLSVCDDCETGDNESAFDRLEDSVQRVINAKYGCGTDGYEGIVHEADCIACAYEMSYGGWCADVALPEWAAASSVSSYVLHSTYAASAGTVVACFLGLAAALGMHDGEGN